jgi:hypothetical protein
VTAVENLIATVLVLLAPVGLCYGWIFFWTRMRHEPRSWRTWVTVVSLALASLAVLSWPVMAVLAPKADWGTYVGVRSQVEWVEAWHRPIFRTLLAAFVLCFFGRPRLILPIAFGCIGAAMFWLFSTMP